MPPDDLTLTFRDRAIAGWTDIRVTRGIERCPSDFAVGLTERYPDAIDDVMIAPGQPATVTLGDDLVITGYIDRFTPSMSARDHRIAATGRSTCCDLVDCAQQWPQCEISGADAFTIAKNLCQFYGITVRCDVSGLQPVPVFNLMVTETCYEVIERCARYSALLVYDEPDGSLHLTRVSQTRSGGGFVEGQNVQEASITYAADQTYSLYKGFAQACDLFTDVGGSGNLVAEHTDPNVLRPRVMVLVAEQGDADFQVLKDRLVWECNRRIGRSRVVRVTCDSWRDANGKLWLPNTLVRVELPSLKLVANDWLISQVTYNRSADRGTTAEVELMLPQAFAPEPILLLPFQGDVPYLAGA